MRGVKWHAIINADANGLTMDDNELHVLQQSMGRLL
jgi:hypothetical protein